MLKAASTHKQTISRSPRPVVSDQVKKKSTAVHDSNTPKPLGERVELSEQPTKETAAKVTVSTDTKSDSGGPQGQIHIPYVRVPAERPKLLGVAEGAKSDSGGLGLTTGRNGTLLAEMKPLQVFGARGGTDNNPEQYVGRVGRQVPAGETHIATAMDLEAKLNKLKMRQVASETAQQMESITEPVAKKLATLSDEPAENHAANLADLKSSGAGPSGSAYHRFRAQAHKAAGDGYANFDDMPKPLQSSSLRSVQKDFFTKLKADSPEEVGELFKGVAGRANTPRSANEVSSLQGAYLATMDTSSRPEITRRYQEYLKS